MKNQAKPQAAQLTPESYFTPGAIVHSYGGHDRVLSFHSQGMGWMGWAVKVQAVRQVGKDGPWVPLDGIKGRTRIHCTQPDFLEIRWCKTCQEIAKAEGVR